MRFRVGDQEYSLEFSRKFKQIHVQDPFVKQARNTIRSTYPYTTATLFVVDDGPRAFWKIHRTYTVGCFKTDSFTYELGRKVALTCMLRGNSLTKEFKTLVWKAYFGRFEEQKRIRAEKEAKKGKAVEGRILPQAMVQIIEAAQAIQA